MDYLEQSIERLNDEERSEFRAFLTKQKLNRMDVKLFNIIASDEKIKGREMVSKLYQPVNMNAYHSLRKRLMNQLLSFIVMRRLEHDATKASRIMGMISMGQFMIEKGAFEACIYFLDRAEDLARKNHQYDLLNTIYSIEITNADALNVRLDDVIEKWQQNNIQNSARQKLDLAFAIIRNKLALARREGTTLDPEDIMASVFEEFEITTLQANNPSFMFKIVSMTRSAIVSTKDYFRFEPFILRIYTQMKDSEAFSSQDVNAELGFLYMISHVFYRNRKFAETTIWLDSMRNSVPLQTFRLSIYYPKYIAMLAAVASYSGKNEDAIEIIKSARNDNALRFAVKERLNMDLNLAVYYFQSGGFKQANRVLRDIGHSDRWLEEKMGKEWRFKKNMIELIIQIELGNGDLALGMVRSVEKYFGSFLSHPVYQRARFFLGFIRKLIINPDVVTKKDFAEEVKNARMGWPGEKEDIQAITFFCWLKSKMLNRDYYEVLLEAMVRE